MGLSAFASSLLRDRYSRPGLFIAWEWIALAAAVYLVRRLIVSENDNHGLLNVLLASAVSVGGLSIYQSLTEPLDLASLNVAAPDLKSNLAGNDEFYPELNRPMRPASAMRGTFGGPQTLFIFMALTLPAAMAVARSGWIARTRRLLLVVPVVIAAAAAVALLTRPFEANSLRWSPAIGLIAHHPILGVGPGNLSRMLPVDTVPNSAWLSLAATGGVIGLGLLFAAIAVAVRQASPRGGTVASTPTRSTRWEFHLGGAAGLVLGFIWAFGEVPAEAPPSEVFKLGGAAVFRAILWFVAFGLLETGRPSSRSLCRAILIGVAFAIVLGLISNSPGQPTVLFPIVILLAIAANLQGPIAEKSDGPWTRAGRVAGVILAAGLAIACLVTAGVPAWATASAVRQARMASRLFPERDRAIDHAPAGPQRANALTSARGFLLANIINPLKDAADRDPGNAALWLEIGAGKGRFGAMKSSATKPKARPA